MKKTALSCALLLMLLTGCTANPATAPETFDPSPDPAQTATEPAEATTDAPAVEGFVDSESGQFAFVAGEATGDVILPVEGPEDVEDLRTQLEQDEVTYLTVSVQNPEGGTTLELESVTLSTLEGQELQFRPAPLVLQEWGAAANDGEPAPEVVPLVEQYSGGALPDSTTELLMIGEFPEIPDTVQTVLVQPVDGDAVEALVRPES